MIKTSEENINKLAFQMGMPPQKNLELWLEKGYISIIRSCWHILPYNQLLGFRLGREKACLYIKRDDFSRIKFGDYKHRCEEIIYIKLTDSESEQTSSIKEVMLRDVRKYDDEDALMTAW